MDSAKIPDNSAGPSPSAGATGCDLRSRQAPRGTLRILVAGQGWPAGDFDRERPRSGLAGGHFRAGSCWLPGCWAESCDQGGDERAKQGFAATACVVHELEEAEIEQQLVLRETPVRAEPGAQQGPEAFDGVDVHLAEAVAVLVAGVFTLSVADALVLVAPDGQAGVDAILVGVDEGALWQLWPR